MSLLEGEGADAGKLTKPYRAFGERGTHTNCGTAPEVGVGSSKWENLVWESSAELIGMGILPSGPGWFS